jgi:hypothetical protein
MTSHMGTGCCYGLRSMILKRSCSAPLKWASRLSCPGIETLLMVTAGRITGSAGCGTRTAISWSLRVPMDRRTERGVRASIPSGDRYRVGLKICRTDSARIRCCSRPIAAAGIPTDPLGPDGWERARDALADVWDWWGEGVHLRPQPKLRERNWHFDDPPFVFDLVKHAARRANYNQPTPPRPLRTATVDAHLGYALFHLNCFVHGLMSEAKGWMPLATEEPEVAGSLLRSNIHSRPQCSLP